MPTYEYTCKKCGESLEVFQSFSDKPLKKHADCGGELVKVLHARGILFKGSGFYATDGRGSSSSSSSGSNGSKEMTSTEKAATPAAD
ncbi:MAG TPA: FmdB family zinc ribbon protein [Acidimicrobiia bacterium]